jgi:hypothetical protein
MAEATPSLSPKRAVERMLRAVEGRSMDDDEYDVEKLKQFATASRTSWAAR